MVTTNPENSFAALFIGPHGGVVFRCGSVFDALDGIAIEPDLIVALRRMREPWASELADAVSAALEPDSAEERKTVAIPGGGHLWVERTVSGPDICAVVRRASPNAGEPKGSAMSTDSNDVPSESDGRVESVSTNNQGTAEKFNRDKELIESEARYRLLAENSNDLITRLSEDGTVLDASPASSRILGIDPRQLVGKKLEDLVLATPRETADGGTLAPYQTPNGRVWLETRVRPVSGSSSERVAVSRDATRRVAIQDALRHSEATVRAILDTAADGIITISDTGTIDVYNRAAEQMFGFTREEVVGQNISMLMPSSTAAQHDTYLDRCNRGMGGSGLMAKRELIARHKNGREFPIELAVSEVTTDQGRFYAGILRDISERKATEIELKESERRFRTLADHAPMIIWMSSPDLAATFFNQEMIRFSGRPLSRLLGRAWSELIHPDDQRVNQSAYLQAMNRESAFRLEFRYLRCDGVYRWMHALGVPRYSPTGEFIGFVGSAIDLTERKEAEEDLRTSNRMLEAIRSSQSALLSTGGLDQAYDNILNALVELTGSEMAFIAESEGRPGARIWALLPGGSTVKESPACIGRLLDLSLQARGPWISDRPKSEVAPSEHPSVVSFLGIPIGSEDRPLGVVGIANRPGGYSLGFAETLQPLVATCASLIEASRSEERRRQAEEQLRFQAQITEQMHEALIQLDLAGTIVGWNAGAQRQFGYEAAEILGQPVERLYIEADRAIIQARLIQPAARSGAVTVEMPMLRKSGESIECQLMVSAVRNAEGTVVGVVGYVMDISARKTAEAEILRLNQQLEERVANRTAQLERTVGELESFSYSVSHDLRAPIRAISAYTSLLLEEHSDELTPKAAKLLRNMKRSASRMGSLIDDLLAFSRLSRQPLQRHTIDPTPLVHEAFREAIDVEEDRQVRLDVGRLPSCYADASLLRQVLTNLLANSVKFTRSRDVAVIEVTGEQIDDRSVYRVRDNGVGFDPRFTHKLFGVFERLHAIDEYEGTGVGLAIAHQIVTRHGGAISGESVLNEFAEFTIELPSEAVED